MTPTRQPIHRRLSTFVDWIRPEESREDEIRRQADLVRQRVRDQAHADGLVIASTPRGGSFAKNTGLRRHITGGSEVEGLDVDLHFVVRPRTRDEEWVANLLPRFERYARQAFPGHSPERTKSSVVLRFTGTRLSYDLVPLFATEAEDWQILERRDGERVRTSVQRHVEFIKARTRSSNEVAGRVKFNECVRLVKWWREFKLSDSSRLDDVPSLLIDLLCAGAFDARGVQATYHETLLDWFGWMASAAQRRQRVAFRDFHPSLPAPAYGVTWEVLDAVNPANNVVRRWGGWQVDLLGQWLADARDGLARATRLDAQSDDVGSLRELVLLFGSPFKHHSEPT